MKLTLRRDNVIASYLYFGLTTLNLASNYYTSFKLIVLVVTRKGDNVLTSIAFAILILTPVFLAWLGFGIRAGKPYAKALFLAFFTWNVYLILRQVPTLADSAPNYWAVLRNLLSLIILSIICYFLFRNNFTHRPNASIKNELFE
ncbi:hypothetical protein [Hymenobacter sp. AT01-02]|uniref:hypothetical protein n=1 Tax=Hymenobacter sp. AT01-02 TaxID=1571877 RepID=UPI0005F1B329|nr:hypothetical protein [Hymenobacter sp. AT01-02]